MKPITVGQPFLAVLQMRLWVAANPSMYEHQKPGRPPKSSLRASAFLASLR
jgi:hypothetical protein